MSSADVRKSNEEGKAVFMKRLISLFLAALMAFSALCAFAEEEIIIDDTQPGFNALPGAPVEDEMVCKNCGAREVVVYRHAAKD